MHAEAEYGIAVQNGGVKVIMGKVVDLPSIYAFYRSFPSKSRKSETLCLDSRVSWMVMQDPRIAEIHFGSTNLLFTIPKERFWRNAELQTVRGVDNLCVPTADWLELQPWYDVGMAPSERLATERVPATLTTCRAGSVAGVNYRKPHVPVMGRYSGKPRASCLFCGCWIDPEEADDHTSAA